ncbi:MAG: tRNA (uridine(34)/cytosine(34)/5-carboxymethylaminomethyluridine(34)-2'-O)-methyltransferase TrmL [Betaproteobacteria bacterium RIFCSPLOWO2_02_64_14]|jgi:tRNA (cytidine/uridine-2'-O-)-methyltransferase|nr:MAG: tRNA (uridine(34)/cytosine(34)/5-carboxymethylaminomethyluridine(34)-2'-O)-methyltransferase TrmL [Betaproteobacteria bacterium RIFCSPLOWO2_02_64_14]
MLDIVLYEPEIPPNTGNIIRLAANTGAGLHLVRPLGFSLRDKQLQRARLDYQALGGVTLHADWRACCRFFGGRRMFAVSTKAKRRYDSIDFHARDVLVFGPETRGLPAEVMAHFELEFQICIPMRSDSRSLNLSNAVAVVLYEAWRQHDFSLRRV